MYSCKIWQSSEIPHTTGRPPLPWSSVVSGKRLRPCPSASPVFGGGSRVTPPPPKPLLRTIVSSWTATGPDLNSRADAVVLLRMLVHCIQDLRGVLSSLQSFCLRGVFMVYLVKDQRHFLFKIMLLQLNWLGKRIVHEEGLLRNENKDTIILSEPTGVLDHMRKDEEIYWASRVPLCINEPRFGWLHNQSTLQQCGRTTCLTSFSMCTTRSILIVLIIDLGLADRDGGMSGAGGAVGRTFSTITGGEGSRRVDIACHCCYKYIY